MSRPRVSVQHCVVNLTTTQYGPHPTSNLIGVDYYRAYPLDAEFPRTIPTLDVFVRFFLWRARPTTIAVRVWRLRPNGANWEMVNQYLFEIPFQSHEIVYDKPFRLVNVRLPGEGEYAVRVCRPRQPQSGPARWRILATDYFRVVKS